MVRKQRLREVPKVTKLCVCSATVWPLPGITSWVFAPTLGLPNEKLLALHKLLLEREPHGQWGEVSGCPMGAVWGTSPSQDQCLLLLSGASDVFRKQVAVGASDSLTPCWWCLATGLLCLILPRRIQACLVASVMFNSATLWTVAHQAPLSMGFSRQEYRSGLLFPSPDLSQLRDRQSTQKHWDAILCSPGRACVLSPRLLFSLTLFLSLWLLSLQLHWLLLIASFNTTRFLLQNPWLASPPPALLLPPSPECSLISPAWPALSHPSGLKYHSSGSLLWPHYSKILIFSIILCHDHCISLFLSSTHWKRPWCWEGLGAGGEGDDRGWDGWMASPTWWTWVWVNWELVMDREAWRAVIHGVAKSRTWLSNWTELKQNQLLLKDLCLVVIMEYNFPEKRLLLY